LSTDPIEDITPHRLLVWRNDLRQSGYAEATVASIFKTIRAMCNMAVEQDWLSKSPMKNIPHSSFINRNNDRLITMEEYARLLEACPTQELRVIIAAARIGGLQVPSELTTMRWRQNTPIAAKKFWKISENFPKTARKCCKIHVCDVFS
jgi:hypothetical protein